MSRLVLTTLSRQAVGDGTMGLNAHTLVRVKQFVES